MGRVILLADDDAEDSELLEEALIKHDPEAHVERVASGQEAIKYLLSHLERKLPCMVILDYKMPGLNGADVLMRIAEDQRLAEIPKVVWSTSSENAHIEACRRAGAIDYFIKPTNSKLLGEMARRMVNICRRKQA
jgi:CheY-like chemotaxis protein